MSEVKAQYEAFPYPARDPADEAKRLITGSPSHVLEIDHFLFQGRRDWSKPLRALIAGGGTGDGLIQLAQQMKDTGRAAEITYLDLSTASRAIAEERARLRGLSNIRFVTGSLMDAASHGHFDYIDCCGVLHHLPDPAAGFAALLAALAPGGGMGFMVYAPYGRAGVYPLQEAFGALYAGLPPEARLKAAKEVVANLPEGHPFKSNPNLGDHKDSDAGFYDLLLHSQDRAFDVTALVGMLDDTGWALSGFALPVLYDLSRITTVPDHLSATARMALAEKLRGTIKTHVGYATRATEARPSATGRDRALIPHLKGLRAPDLARAIAQGQTPKLRFNGIEARLALPKEAAPLLAAIDGRRSLSQIAQASGIDPIAFGSLWARIERDLGDHGLLLFSSILRP
ncbi:Methylase involved in ubiquinone/menaquinone biosynthesis [Roseovarius mucosus DSM 17069]|uniref:Methylase involved in ubiquinone/menaquinone biosynthesis n=1 Tax=Roseovarius mucosus DSM 17069 TaxID=1288298 RepID=A0A0A0HRJ2_9RHOB|nr:class I SAM-dependent methyltransferase [Roseovarius mucosus]KGM89234.1 Methylase involved in ubiquinone/menaquinone biosynthesis [Roseovarius mucosus DSM 17069]